MTKTIIYEDDDLSWANDDCPDANCSSGNCRAIKERLRYQRLRNRFIREMNACHRACFNDGLSQEDINGMILKFKAQYNPFEKSTQKV